VRPAPLAAVETAPRLPAPQTELDLSPPPEKKRKGAA